MKYLINTCTDPYYNMALDEFCLEHIVSDEPYFYLWRNCPSVIIGLNQNAYGEVNLDYLNSHGIKLVRRMTGGGAVYHDLQNMNYTIIGRDPSPKVMVDALRSLGLDAEATGRNDIFVDGKKVSGYARRVSKRQEIIHGTLMYDVDLETLTQVLDVPGSKLESKGIASVKSRVTNLKEHLPQFASLDELQAKLQEILAGEDCEIVLTPEMKEQVQKMARTKFETWEFIYGQSHEADFRNSRKLACGTVTAEVSIYKGIIKKVSFSGDFMFGKPAEELAAKLEGIRYEKDSLTEVLEKEDVSSYFKGVSAQELAQLIACQ